MSRRVLMCVTLSLTHTHVFDVCHDSFICESWLVHTSAKESLMRDLIQMSHGKKKWVTRVNEPRFTYKWVMTHIKDVWCFFWNHYSFECDRMSRVDESCHTCERVTRLHPHPRALFEHMNDSCHTYQYIMSLIWMSHVTCKWVMSHMWMSDLSPHSSSRGISAYEWVIWGGYD